MIWIHMVTLHRDYSRVRLPRLKLPISVNLIYQIGNQKTLKMPQRHNLQKNSAYSEQNLPQNLIYFTQIISVHPWQIPCLAAHPLPSCRMPAPPRQIVLWPASLFVLGPALALMVGHYADSSELSYTTTSGVVQMGSWVHMVDSHSL